MSTIEMPNCKFECWMGEMKDKGAPWFEDRPLKDIVIPGSHNAGTYLMESSVHNTSSKCQEVSVFDQLRAGSRYLDLRAWKAKDGMYWMFHGKVWAHVKLEDVLADINSFLTKFPSEIVVATLLIGEEAGWKSACDQVKPHLVTTAHLKGKSFADATPRELRDLGKRLILLRQDYSEQFASMDRGGIYAGTLRPEDTAGLLERYPVPQDKMWILHLNMPFTAAEIVAAIFSVGRTYIVQSLFGGSLKGKSEYASKYWIPRLKGEGNDSTWLTRRLNIINLDFVEQFGWVEAVVNLNLTYPKTWPQFMPSQTVEQSYTWKLRAYNQDGKLWLDATTNAPFRAQEGQIHVYPLGSEFPTNPNGKAETWQEDYNAHPWNTNLDWTPGRPVAWVAQQSPDGPNVLFLALNTEGSESVKEMTFTWKFRAVNNAGTMYLDGDNDAPFRAQEGQIHVYPLGSEFPTNPNGMAEKWEEDYNAHPWNTNLDWTPGRPVAWVAQQSPDGPNALFLKQTLGPANK